ncbi:S1 family peptidase [Kitasatospora purpeofusca]|uniref:S1 family peptidase n=1 Tax=Kitasatospora purpeofusca TaxID=67352 RepID=UPI003866593D|nr:S1 family peptidase [Kitasatospora purpeofusca]
MLSISIAVPAVAESAGPGGGGKGKRLVVSSSGADRAVTDRIRNQEVLDGVVDRLTGGLSEVERERIPGFTDVEVDPGRNKIRLHWKGEISSAAHDVLGSLPAGVVVEVLPAKYSKAEMHQARERLLHDGKPQQLVSGITGAGTRITHIAPAVDGSGLEIGYDEEQPQARTAGLTQSGKPEVDDATRKTKTDEVKAATNSLAGIETDVTYAPIAIDATRGEDYSPWWGGSGLETPGGTICSSGFGVTRSDGTPLLTTAYHCGDGTYHNWYNGAFVGSTSQADMLDILDVSGINTGNAVGAGVYDGPWNEPNGLGRYVSGWGHNNVGDYVCQSAANSGTHCGLQITQTDFSFLGPNGVWRKVADYAVQTNGNDIAAANGDSGGPVYTVDSGSGKAVARGTLSALKGTVDCNGRTTSDGGSRTPWCFSAMMYVPIYQILHDKGWTINTG